MISFIKPGPMLSGPGDFDLRRLLTVLNNSFCISWLNKNTFIDTFHRQSLAVLMASSTVVVLKHETSFLRQRHNLISHLASVITLGRSPALLKLVRIR